MKKLLIPIMTMLMLASPTLCTAATVSKENIQQNKINNVQALSNFDKNNSTNSFAFSENDQYKNVRWHNTWPNQQMSLSVPKSSSMKLGDSTDLLLATSGTNSYGEQIPDLSNIPLDEYYTLHPDVGDHTALIIDIIYPDGQNRDYRNFDTDAYGQHYKYDSKIFTPTESGTYKIYYSMFLTMGGNWEEETEITVYPKQGSINVKYVDDSGNELQSSKTITGKIGDSYDATTPEYKVAIAGYTLDETKLPTNSKGTITGDQTTVTYQYKKNEVIPSDKASVLVKYVDENGNKIAKSETKTGNVDEAYVTEKKDIKGYIYKEVKGNISGKFTDKEQIVTYVYTKDLSELTPNTSNNSSNNHIDLGKQDILPSTGLNTQKWISYIGVGLLVIIGLVAGILKIGGSNKGKH